MEYMEYLKKIYNKHTKSIISLFAVIFGFFLAYTLNYKSSKKQALMLIWNEK